MPLISVITINYNNLEGLKKTMQSVFEQTVTDYEYIIIDGGSTDGSKEMIEEHADKITCWISEKDAGIFNAMNKGLVKASGKYLLFLNSGDSFYDNYVLQKAKEQFSTDYKIYYGDVLRVYSGGKKLIKKYNSELTFSFFHTSAIAHQSAFIEKQLFSTLFLYNEAYKVFADWEFFVCAICKYQVPYKHLGIVVSVYDMDGISSLPENQKIYRKEKELTFQKYFALFQKDYEELFRLRSYYNRYRLFAKIESIPVIGKVNYWFIKVLEKLFFRSS